MLLESDSADIEIVEWNQVAHVLQFMKVHQVDLHVLCSCETYSCAGWEDHIRSRMSTLDEILKVEVVHLYYV